MNRKRQQRIVCVDTNVPIWGIRKEGNPEKIEHAVNLFAELDAEKDEFGHGTVQILIPTVVLTEFVTLIRSKNERDKVISAISQRFTVAPFDTRAVSLAADLWNVAKTSGKNRKMPKPGNRQMLRADSMIVAKPRLKRGLWLLFLTAPGSRNWRGRE